MRTDRPAFPSGRSTVPRLAIRPRQPGHGGAAPDPRDVHSKVIGAARIPMGDLLVGAV